MRCERDLETERLAAGRDRTSYSDILSMRRDLPYYGYVDHQLDAERHIVLFCANDCPTSLSILRTGEATDEVTSLELWTTLAKRSQTVLDVGAHVGLFSLAAGTCSNRPKVFSFEPSPLIYSRLCVNVLSNRLAWIKPQFLAVSRDAGHADIFFKENFNFLSTAGTLEPGSAAPESRSVRIQTTTIDMFIDANAISKVDLVKVDVENHEAAVIDGFTTIENHKPFVLMELLNRAAFDEMQARMQPRGYRTYGINDSRSTGEKLFDVNGQWPTEQVGRNFLFAPMDMDRASLRNTVGF